MTGVWHDGWCFQSSSLLLYVGGGFLLEYATLKSVNGFLKQRNEPLKIRENRGKLPFLYINFPPADVSKTALVHMEIGHLAFEGFPGIEYLVISLRANCRWWFRMSDCDPQQWRTTNRVLKFKLLIEIPKMI